mmetsp:Transcript_13507/g.22590  ORF Transcript_13507/g.22590 Transcript_13507/m.22590 type:complete len:108 (+) Transcript_13507:136-459(+)
MHFDSPNDKDPVGEPPPNLSTYPGCSQNLNGYEEVFDPGGGGRRRCTFAQRLFCNCCRSAQSSQYHDYLQLEEELLEDIEGKGELKTSEAPMASEKKNVADQDKAGM